jgi:putative transposase
MPRRARLFLDGETLHVTRRGNNRAECFIDDFDRIAFLALLGELAREFGAAVHAYALMGNHVHLLMTPRVASHPSALMHDLALGYARYFNRKYRRTGSLWDGRFWAAPVRTDAYVLACHRYVELNPVRAGIVEAPAEYSWSSHRANIGRDASAILTLHPSIRALGSSTESARRAYAALFDLPLDPADIASLRFGLDKPVPGSNPVPVQVLNCRAASRA